MTIDAPAPNRGDTDRGTRGKQVWWRRPWIFPLAFVTVAFLVFALPPYLGLDPSLARIPVDRHPIFYPVLLVHIFAGAILLCCGVLQLWPWLRSRHRRVHRWTGRIYVLLAIPVGVGGLFIAQFPAGGPTQQVANTLLSVLLLATTAAGYRAVRQRRFGDHREWMIRSFALAFSIATSRVWLIIFVMIFAPPGFGASTATMMAAAAPAGWASWVVNLLFVEWWLHRRHRQRGASVRRTQPSTDSHPGR